MLRMEAEIPPLFQQQPPQFNVIKFFFVTVLEAVAFQEDEVPVRQASL